MVVSHSYFVGKLDFTVDNSYLRIMSRRLFIEASTFQGTVVEGTIQKLFEGHHMNYIECMNVDYKSTRKESFYGRYFLALGCHCLHIILLFADLLNFNYFIVDLQLDVKGCTDVYASFDKYVEVEQLEGDNKYHAEQYGLQVKSLTMYFSFWLSE
jgi:ubiquitin carboxyl-terminal hydrolase 7